MEHGGRVRMLAPVTRPNEGPVHNMRVHQFRPKRRVLSLFPFPHGLRAILAGRNRVWGGDANVERSALVHRKCRCKDISRAGARGTSDLKMAMPQRLVAEDPRSACLHSSRKQACTMRALRRARVTPTAALKRASRRRWSARPWRLADLHAMAVMAAVVSACSMAALRAMEVMTAVVSACSLGGRGRCDEVRQPYGDELGLSNASTNGRQNTWHMLPN